MAAIALGLAGVAGCGDSAGPEAGEVTVEDLQGLEDQLTGLEDRVGVLEDRGVSDGAVPGGDMGAGDDTDAFFGDTGSYVGQQVTVSAEISELTTTTEIGSALRIAGEGAEPIAVVSATPPPQLDRSDVVRVTGTVVQVQRDSFEEDFGIIADELFEDADAWFDEAEGQVAISASEIEVLQEQANG
jgi:hypothetical protein